MTRSFEQAIADFAPALPLAVAYSGGADSTALLLACARQWPGQVTAVHVHHGLQAAGDDFERHCRSFCADLNVPLVVQKVDARHAPGQSPEAAARHARYQAIDALALHGQLAIQTIAIAQHADDQVETLLLALSRGAGLPGLSAMAAQWQRGGLTYCRPLLQVSGIAIRDWLQTEGARFIEDPSNVDERFTRNRIRARVLPVLQACFPQFRDTFTRSSRHAAQAQVLLQEVAAEDLARVGVPPDVKALQALSPARLANLLRHWLLSAHQATPTSAQLEALTAQIAACRTRGHQIHLKVGQGFCVRRGKVLDWYNPHPLQPSSNPSCP
ncbi:tRNA lysidine(34) synthetase TilS [Rhodoferax sp.]|uniref:tRNA lysidine(34) synthetase TilS n=1 Tax=Rhodoferax sp. TaxID=50421 RepID=UPI002727D95A|nr:tRNA lysidine(34) synthetase TilS [Rhodoferax sp.]MDO9143903.1 tRNA lysidine(34) synthetase TilS [Rhodoferax sp.]MDP1528855.1 tRNA lysidine(34) synthetase TilS [Rhodoferax sp.]MDP1943541.1 tRNA lysidine(34) synthetase TilS [Rhodoferax sp.]MDP2442046.1 tRNA lysidine(34) synthetase TilS [Rhodoferax sp.]MDP3863795.1 tRNA lysidine(34) synthetase TilS [Rhodoferax sp.]